MTNKVRQLEQGYLNSVGILITRSAEHMSSALSVTLVLSEQVLVCA